MKLSIVIPVYNEKNTIEKIIGRVQNVNLELDKEILLVDDGSTDGTQEILRELETDKVRIFIHEKNQGKGKALQTGFSKASGDFVIIQDADLEYDPKEYPQLLAPLLDGRADAVYGSRFLGGPHRVLFFWHYLGNKMLTTFSNMLSNLNLTDMETCYKVFRKEILDKITAQILLCGYRIYEVPISYSGRDYSEGKKIGWKDGVAAIFHIIRFKFFDRS